MKTPVTALVMSAHAATPRLARHRAKSHAHCPSYSIGPRSARSFSVTAHALGRSGPFALSLHPAVTRVSAPLLHLAFRYASMTRSSESSFSQSQGGFHSRGLSLLQPKRFSVCARLLSTASLAGSPSVAHSALST